MAGDTMTRYRVPVADPMLQQRNYWIPVEGLRLISDYGPWLAHPDVTICTFEDDNAPPEFEGKLIELVVTAGGGKKPVITARNVVPG
jgi:hypothetical protein